MSRKSYTYTHLRTSRLTTYVGEEPCYEASPAKSVFLAWLLSEVCAYRSLQRSRLYASIYIYIGRFRHSEHYGQHTVNQSKIFRARNRGPQPPPQLDKRFQPAVDLLIRLLFFGIPHTYLAHIKNSGDYRGRLSSIHANWVAYIDRLVREYSHFLLIVSRNICIVLHKLNVVLLPVGHCITFVSYLVLPS